MCCYKMQWKNGGCCVCYYISSYMHSYIITVKAVPAVEQVNYYTEYHSINHLLLLQSLHYIIQSKPVKLIESHMKKRKKKAQAQNVYN